MRICVHIVALVLVAPAFVAMTGGAASALPFGSFTFTYDGRAPDGTMIRVGLDGVSAAGGKHPLAVDFVMDISGNNRTEATERLVTQLRDRLQKHPDGNTGFEIRRVSPSSIDVLDRQGGAILMEVFGGSSQAGFPVRLDGGDVSIVRDLKPGARWHIGIEPTFAPEQASAGSFEGFAADSGVPQRLAADVEVLATHSFSALVPANATAAEAALLLFEAMVEAGFPDVALEGTTVSFLLGPANGPEPPLPIIAIPDLAFTGDNRLITLTIPETFARVSGPATWLLVALGLAGTWLRRERKATRPGAARED